MTRGKEREVDGVRKEKERLTAAVTLLVINSLSLISYLSFLWLHHEEEPMTNLINLGMTKGIKDKKDK